MSLIIKRNKGAWSLDRNIINNMTSIYSGGYITIFRRDKQIYFSKNIFIESLNDFLDKVESEDYEAIIMMYSKHDKLTNEYSLVKLPSLGCFLIKDPLHSEFEKVSKIFLSSDLKEIKNIKIIGFFHSGDYLNNFEDDGFNYNYNNKSSIWVSSAISAFISKEKLQHKISSSVEEEILRLIDTREYLDLDLKITIFQNNFGGMRFKDEKNEVTSEEYYNSHLLEKDLKSYINYVRGRKEEINNNDIEIINENEEFEFDEQQEAMVDIICENIENFIKVNLEDLIFLNKHSLEYLIENYPLRIAEIYKYGKTSGCEEGEKLKLDKISCVDCGDKQEPCEMLRLTSIDKFLCSTCLLMNGGEVITNGMVC